MLRSRQIGHLILISQESVLNKGNFGTTASCGHCLHLSVVNEGNGENAISFGQKAQLSLSNLDKDEISVSCGHLVQSSFVKPERLVTDSISVCEQSSSISLGRFGMVVIFVFLQ